MNNKITILDKNGNQLTAQGLSYIYLAGDNSHEYIMYTLNEVINGDLTKIYVAKVNEPNLDIDDNEWENIKRSMLAIVHKEEVVGLSYKNMFDENGSLKSFTVENPRKIALKMDKLIGLQDEYRLGISNPGSDLDTPAVNPSETAPTEVVTIAENGNAAGDVPALPISNVAPTESIQPSVTVEPVVVETPVVETPVIPAVETVNAISENTGVLPTSETVPVLNTENNVEEQVPAETIPVVDTAKTIESIPTVETVPVAETAKNSEEIIQNATIPVAETAKIEEVLPISNTVPITAAIPETETISNVAPINNIKDTNNMPTMSNVIPSAIPSAITDNSINVKSNENVDNINNELLNDLDQIADNSKKVENELDSVIFDQIINELNQIKNQNDDIKESIKKLSNDVVSMNTSINLIKEQQNNIEEVSDTLEKVEATNSLTEPIVNGATINSVPNVDMAQQNTALESDVKPSIQQSTLTNEVNNLTNEPIPSVSVNPVTQEINSEGAQQEVTPTVINSIIEQPTTPPPVYNQIDNTIVSTEPTQISSPTEMQLNSTPVGSVQPLPKVEPIQQPQEVVQPNVQPQVIEQPIMQNPTVQEVPPISLDAQIPTIEVPVFDPNAGLPPVVMPQGVSAGGSAQAVGGIVDPLADLNAQ